MDIVWIKALHLIFMVTWFCGLFYLPRLFVYHAMTTDHAGNERFKIMERKLFYGITTPGGLLTLFFGCWLMYDYAWQQYINTLWMQIKLLLIALLVVFHIYCGYCMLKFKQDSNKHSHIYYRWLNEMPVIVLVGSIILAKVRPF